MEEEGGRISCGFCGCCAPSFYGVRRAARGDPARCGLGGPPGDGGNARQLKIAEERKASVLLMRLDTPGGLMEASREMVEMMLASPVPVVAFVSPGSARAASAGFFLLMAADVAAMAPGTRTGAASPVMMGQEVDPVMRRKIERRQRMRS